MTYKRFEFAQVRSLVFSHFKTGKKLCWYFHTLIQITEDRVLFKLSSKNRIINTTQIHKSANSSFLELTATIQSLSMYLLGIEQKESHISAPQALPITDIFSHNDILWICGLHLDQWTLILGVDGWIGEQKQFVCFGKVFSVL